MSYPQLHQNSARVRKKSYNVEARQPRTKATRNQQSLGFLFENSHTNKKGEAGLSSLHIRLSQTLCTTDTATGRGGGGGLNIRNKTREHENWCLWWAGKVKQGPDEMKGRRKKKKVTTRRIPAWSPTAVLTTPVVV